MNRSARSATIDDAITRIGPAFLQFWCDCSTGPIELVRTIASNRDQQFRPRQHPIFAAGYPAGLAGNPHRAIDVSRDITKPLRTARLELEALGCCGATRSSPRSTRPRPYGAIPWPTLDPAPYPRRICPPHPRRRSLFPRPVIIADAMDVVAKADHNGAMAEDGASPART
jgi:hypothetical protein